MLKAIKEDLDTVFRYIDSNRDGFLDEEELAVYFRGPKAEPYARQAAGKMAKESKAEGDSKDQSKDSGKAAAMHRVQPSLKEMRRYPDFQFLMALDKNNDGKISREEFDDWADRVAVEIKAFNERYQEQLARAKKLQEELVTKTLPRALQAKYQEELMILHAQLQSALMSQKHVQWLERMAARKNYQWRWYFRSYRRR